jgi:hypothetical protein
LVQVEVASERPQFGQESDQILEAASETVDRLSSDHVDLTRRRILQQPIKTWTLVTAFAAADTGILVNANDFPPDRAATASSSRRWFSVVCPPVETLR